MKSPVRCYLPTQVALTVSPAMLETPLGAPSVTPLLVSDDCLRVFPCVTSWIVQTGGFTNGCALANETTQLVTVPLPTVNVKARLVELVPTDGLDPQLLSVGEALAPVGSASETKVESWKQPLSCCDYRCLLTITAQMSRRATIHDDGKTGEVASGGQIDCRRLGRAGRRSGTSCIVSILNSGGIVNGVIARGAECANVGDAIDVEVGN